MLVKVERARFEEMRKTLSEKLGKELVDESALPSYLHSNPLIPWIVWKRLATVLELAGEKALSGNVLDFGCGTGSLLPSLCSTAKKVFGTDLHLDFSEQLVADERLPADLLTPEELDEHIADKSLSLITAVEVLEHIDDSAELLAKLKGYLKDDGLFVVSLPTENFIYGVCRAIAGFKGDYHKKNADDIHKDIEAAGFVAKERKYLPFPLLPSLFVVTAFAKQDGEQ